jgi:hypothetical protein
MIPRPPPQPLDTAERMVAVQAALDRTPDGPKKTAALTHMNAARWAMAARHDGECQRELDSATYALA